MFQQSASRILQQCSRIIIKQNKNVLNTNSSKQQSKSQSKSQQKKKKLNLQRPILKLFQQCQNLHMMQKFKKKINKKKLQKQNVIRKTDLGESQLIFTKQQLQRLKQIDDLQMWNLVNQREVLKEKSNGEKLQNDRAQKQYFPNPNFQNSKQQIAKYLQWVDLKEMSKIQNKKKNKIITFQKREKAGILPSFSYNTNQNGKSFLPILLSKYSSPYQALQKPLLNRNKSCEYLINKMSVDKQFLNSLSSYDQLKKKIKTSKERMQQIIIDVNKRIERQLSGISRKHIYMTQQRKQAIFECEVLKGVKREMGVKFYNNLELVFGRRETGQKGQNGGSQQGQRLFTQTQGTEGNQQQGGLIRKGSKQGTKKQKRNKERNTTTSQKSYCNKENMYSNFQKEGNVQNNRDTLFQTQTQTMIHKNLQRLADQKKRVIQKLAY